VGFAITAALVMSCTISLSSASHLPPIESTKLLQPETFPPGFAAVATKP